MSYRWKEISLTIMAGLFITMIRVYLMGFTAAIFIPNYFSSFVLAWDIMVVQFLSVGAISIVVAFFLARIMQFSPNAMVAVLFLSVHFFSGMYYGDLYWFYWPHAVVLGACLILGSRLSYRRGAAYL